jgi:hypothetical protein
LGKNIKIFTDHKDLLATLKRGSPLDMHHRKRKFQFACPSDLYKNADPNQILDYKIMPKIFASETPQGN